MMMIYIWLAVVCVSALIEAFTLQMVGIWFVVGGLVALIMSACGVAIEWQIIACIVISLILLLALRKLCIKFILRKNNEKTNVDALSGLEVKLLKDINDDEMGEVKIGDVVWSAIAEKEGIALKKGDYVTILKVQGNKLVVKAVEKEQSTKEQNIAKDEQKQEETTTVEPEKSVKKRTTKTKKD